MKDKYSPDVLPAPAARNTRGWPWETALPATAGQADTGAEKWPRISVVTPSYNQASFLEKTIRSVLLQGYPNLEYIVMDGGSTDESCRIIERYAAHLHHWESRSDRGQSHAINRGFEHATGEIYAWLNSDDYYLPGALFCVAREFATVSRETGVLVGDGRLVNDRGEVLYIPQVPELTRQALLNWLTWGDFLQPAAFFRSAAWQQCGPLREDLHYCMDLDLWLRMNGSFEFRKLDAALACALRHSEAKTFAQVERMRAETILLLLDHGGRDVAKQELMGLAEDLAEANRKLRRVRKFLPYRLCSPLYFRLQTLLSRKGQG